MEASSLYNESNTEICGLEAYKPPRSGKRKKTYRITGKDTIVLQDFDYKAVTELHLSGNLNFHSNTLALFSEIETLSISTFAGITESKGLKFKKLKVIKMYHTQLHPAFAEIAGDQLCEFHASFSDLDSFPINKLRSLRKISLVHSRLPEITMFNQLENLQDLTIAKCWSKSDMSKLDLSKTPCLRSLLIIYTSNLKKIPSNLLHSNLEVCSLLRGDFSLEEKNQIYAFGERIRKKNGINQMKKPTYE
ncbi:MAG TPA: hypothetical protein DEP18_04955 [Flavobacteriales bacterium]|nr:hypothetical protein [Flavobacteriales bacterium]